MLKYVFSIIFLATSLLAPSHAQEVNNPTLIVSNPMISKIAYDAEKEGTRIGLTFLVSDLEGKPVNGLKAGRNGNFKVFIDGVEETSFETLTDKSISRPPVGITLVLDTSYSMEDQEALGRMKSAAEKFVSKLTSSSSPFNFEYYQFATHVQKIENLKAINTKKAFGQFTSLYSALKIAIEAHPQNIVLLFSDGADNKSPDNAEAAVESVNVIEQLIEKHKTVIHTVKLGIEESNDSKGIDNKEILKRASKNGSLRYVASADELVRAFEDVASKVAYPYYFEYLCPRTKPGSYRIMLQIDRKGTASDRKQFNPEASFELPFELYGNDSRYFMLPGSAAQKIFWEPILFPSNGGGHWDLKLYANEGESTRLKQVNPADLSDMTVSFRDIRFDFAKDEVSFVVVYSGPEPVVRASYLAVKNHDSVGPETFIYQFDLWTPVGKMYQSTSWQSLRTFMYSKEGIEFKELANGMAEISLKPMSLKVNLRPNVTTYVQVTSSFSSNNKQFVLGVNEASLFFVK